MKLKVLIVAFVVWSPRVFANPVSASISNNRGALLLKQERAFEAMQELVEGLATSPFQPEIHLNLGLAFEMQKDQDKALSEYREALRTAEDPALKFAALFNMARIFGEQDKIPEALAHYQQALTLVPDSKETKTNIELLLAQGGGGGKGNKKQKDKGGEGQNENKDDKGDEQRPPQQPNQGQQKKQQQPKPFESQELSQSDVRKILEELKNQEQKIRRKEYDKKAKEAPGGKDW